MTRTATIASPELTQTTPTLTYQVAMPDPASHLFDVTLHVSRWKASVLNLKMPVWTPGSYLVREYAGHVQDFSASLNHQLGSQKQALGSRKLSKNHWQIETSDVTDVTVRYRVYANELTVRTNHLDHTHGYFNGAALFCFIPGYEHLPLTVKIKPYDDWHVTTPLPAISGHSFTFQAKDFDTLVDSPFEIGTHRVFSFEVLDKPHQLAIWGQGNAQPERIINDTAKIIATEAQLFGELPYEHYLFLLHLSSSGYGGLEHKDACSLNYPRFGFRDRDRYHRFMQLVAHEFFHLWNVKRIRPDALISFDYEQENYTSSLWFCEGTTSYYDALIPLRADIYDAKTFLQNLSKDISQYLAIPGRTVQSVSESSFDAWIKLYRPNANRNNSQISYYLKGELISLLLDLMIRTQSQNERSLDDVMRLMWQRFGQSDLGFSPDQLQQVLESVACNDLSDFFTRYIDGIEELPFQQYLAPFGLQLKRVEAEEPIPDLGCTVKNESQKMMITFVAMGGPAQVAGINAGDELVALNGWRITADQLNERLKDYQPGDIIQVSVFHQDELLTYPIRLAEPQPSRYELVRLAQLSETQQHNLKCWLGRT